jgi:predicted amidohydrolase YtcJ
MKIRGTSLLYLAGIVLLSFCAGVFVLRAKAQAAQGESHTVVYLHGRIYTNDPAQPWADAMAIRDGKIRCVGKIDFVLLECGGNDPSAETIQLKGKFVMPGFNDAHVHLGSAGADMLSVRLNGVASI